MKNILLTSVVAALMACAAPVLATPSTTEPELEACHTLEQIVTEAEANGVKLVVLSGKAATDFMLGLFEAFPPPQDYVVAVANAGESLTIAVQDPAGAIEIGVFQVSGGIFTGEGKCSTGLTFAVPVDLVAKLLGNPA